MPFEELHFVSKIELHKINSTILIQKVTLHNWFYEKKEKSSIFS